MKIPVKPQPRPLPMKPKPVAPRGLCDDTGYLAHKRELAAKEAEAPAPVDLHGHRAWYEAIGRIAGIEADEAWRIHYPGQKGPARPESIARYEAARNELNPGAIMAEIRTPRKMSGPRPLTLKVRTR